MQKLPLLAALALSGFGLYGCQTSCGEHRDPLLWADGIKPSKKVYLTTAIDGNWLHFPSYRSYRLPHNFGTKNISVDTYVAFEENPVKSGTTEPSTELATASGSVLLVTEVNTNDIVVENGTCENDYYMLVRITDLDE
jgi:hypothetical protein